MRITEQDYRHMKEFGAFLRAYREQCRRGLNEVAREAGMTSSFLSQLERGEHKRASAESVEALLKALRYPSRYKFFAKAGMVAPDVAATVRKHPDEFARVIFALKELNNSELGAFAQQIEKYVADAKSGRVRVS